MKAIFFTVVTALSASVFGAPVVYECKGDEYYGQTLTMEIEGPEMTVTSNNMDEMNFVTQLDSSYKPRGGAKKLRFNGEKGGYDVAVVIYASMATGSAKQGFIQIRGNQDSYWSANFKCVKQ